MLMLTTNKIELERIGMKTTHNAGSLIMCTVDLLIFVGQDWVRLELLNSVFNDFLP